jgi:hypothetical protein
MKMASPDRFERSTPALGGPQNLEESVTYPTETGSEQPYLGHAGAQSSHRGSP